jgi:hypothetical protein
MLLSYRTAKNFAERLHAATASGTLPDVIMPNGKKYGDCTREEIDGYVASMEEHAEVHEKAARLVPLWTLLQIAMIVWIVYLYTTDKEMGRNATLGHIVLFATLVAFGSIWLLARAAYWLIYVYCRFARREAALGVTTTVSTGRTNDMDNDLGKLTSERVIKMGRGTQLWWREPLKWWESSIWSVMFSMVFFIAVAWGLALLIDDIRWRLLVGVVGTIVCLVMPGGRASIRWLCSSRYRKQWREYRRGGPPPGGPVFGILDYRAHELYWRFFLPVRILGFVLTCVAIVAAIFIAQSTSYSPLVKILIAFVAFQATATVLQLMLSAINWIIRSIFFGLIDVVPAHGTNAEEALAIVKTGRWFELNKKFETEIENWTLENTDEIVKLFNWRARLFFPVKARFANGIPELKRIRAETGKEPRDIGLKAIEEIRSQFPGGRITWLEKAITSPRIFYATLVFVLIVVVISYLG